MQIIFQPFYKARVKGYRDVSMLYAYDTETIKLLCAEVFPGNSIDASSFLAFIKDNNIKKGIIVEDNNFPISSIAENLKYRPILHFITPIRRVNHRINDNTVEIQ